MKTINIKGKEYVPVVERVKEFHNIYQGSIETSYVETNNRVSAKATITILGWRDNATVHSFETAMVYTGHSQAVYGDGMMGDVALEIAETSAIGRALGFANIGLIDGIASADEMRKVKTAKKIDDNELPF